VPVTARAIADVEVDLLDLLSVLAWAGARDEAAAQAALASATAVLGLAGWRVLPRHRVDGRRFEAVLQRLEGASPPLKSRLLEACAASALADGVVVPAEGEIVRAVAASLGVPVPPLAPAATAASAASTA
jgi:DnaJ-domain-containing protein 1